MSDNKIHHPYSPSKIERLSLCPGSFNMCVGIPETSSAEADEGTTCHKACETGIMDALNAEQMQACEFCLEVVHQYEGFTTDNTHREVEMSLLDEDMNVITAGTADVVIADGSVGVVIDYKFGRVKVPHARDHKPIRIYAAMAVQAYDLSEVKVVIVQPRLPKDERVTEFTFSKDELSTVVNEVKQIIDECNHGTQLRYSDNACRYCPAKLRCPEYARNVGATTTELATMDHAHALAHPDVIGEYLSKAKSIKKFLDNLEHHAKDILLKGGTIPGWELRSKRGNRVVKDAQGLFNAVSNVIGVDVFLKCVDVSMADLEDAYVRSLKAKDGTSLKDGKKLLADLSDSFIERKPDSKILTQTNNEE